MNVSKYLRVKVERRMTREDNEVQHLPYLSLVEVYVTINVFTNKMVAVYIFRVPYLKRKKIRNPRARIRLAFSRFCTKLDISIKNNKIAAINQYTIIYDVTERLYEQILINLVAKCFTTKIRCYSSATQVL